VALSRAGRGLAFAALAASVLAATASASALKTKTAQRGKVRATISWRNARFFEAKDVRLRITRSGQTALETVKLGVDRPQTIAVRDLDSDDEAEVIVDFYTGGAHCCFFSRIYGYAGSTYVPVRHVWGNLTYKVRDLNHDGAPELVSADDRFAYVFTAYAFSGFPTRIWEYRSRRLVDVTRSYPALIRRDAARLWKESLRARKADYPDVRGILAAWVADEYLLGREEHAWTTMRSLNRAGVLGGDRGWARGSAYLVKLRKFLESRGY